MDDYVVGSIADLIAGNLTPSRPASLKHPLTPKKHQPSPRITPRSEALPGREALLSPTLQRKKSVAKKSPKRIFEKEDLNVTTEAIASPKTDKVKKHLQADLDSSQNTKCTVNIAVEEVVRTPTKKKKKKMHADKESRCAEKSVAFHQENSLTDNSKSYAVNEENVDVKRIVDCAQKNIGKKKSDKNRKQCTPDVPAEIKCDIGNAFNKEIPNSKKKNKKNKKNFIPTQGDNDNNPESLVEAGNKEKTKLKEKKKRNKNKKKQIIITQPEEHKSDSEHESDNDIESETEQEVHQMLDDGPIKGDTSDEEAETKQKSKQKKKTNQQKSGEDKLSHESDDETQRTLFVGNVPLSKRTKKEIKEIFSKYGTIETIRIRAVPVKDMRTSPKVAVIKGEIHPDRTSVIVYVRFTDEKSVTKALVENNRVLSNHHLRVRRSDTAAAYDPRRALFVGNVPLGIEDEVLRAAFERCGEVESVRIVRDKATQIGKGFGYVNFASSDGVELALGLSEEDLTIKNRILRIRRYTQVPPDQKVRTKPQLQKRIAHQETGQSRGAKQRPGQNRWSSENRGPPNRGYNNFRGQNDTSNRGFGGPNNQGRNDGFRGSASDNRQRDGKPKNDAGALRRINKRSSQDNQGPPEKRSRVAEQPVREKKQKKEFVGMTAEKKKKKKFDKGLKQRQMLSEILTK